MVSAYRKGNILIIRLQKCYQREGWGHKPRKYGIVVCIGMVVGYLIRWLYTTPIVEGNRIVKVHHQHHLIFPHFFICVTRSGDIPKLSLIIDSNTQLHHLEHQQGPGIKEQ